MANEAQRQILELQTKLQETNRQIVQVRTQIQVKEREKKIAELQIRELNAAGPNTKTYTSVGKMFLHIPHEEILSQLQLKGQSLEDDVNVLGKKQAYLEKTYKETQDGVKEAVDALLPSKK
ncbi:Prefoldin beta-like protein [Catenaria anguillulae PL171]|uniref:Prefoldin beta-like protein n=1 Tax=Catenaria anguillulae PL171 TaxID=765915 RepID=A0A1Y2I0U4_9FUNG|nr:Prefoldin beta-like protein [Catenaria anguillulae PL171]